MLKIRNIKRKLISSSFFWKFRLLFQPNVISKYKNKKPPAYFIDFIFQKKIRSILDFGCATANLLLEATKSDPKLICYGVDINNSFLETSIERFLTIKKDPKTYQFETCLKLNKLKTFLLNNEIRKFDLIVFDRVLYCQNNIEIDHIFRNLQPISKYILIDDFFGENLSLKSGYRHRNWIAYLKECGFKNIINIPTVYEDVADAFPRTMIFEKI
tara:strand:+ start:137 stop:778 length:642 start_codon:yes stop_codon:yes gene_type:complete